MKTISKKLYLIALLGFMGLADCAGCNRNRINDGGAEKAATATPNTLSF